jgi:Mn2+/Fe2+ NRAMP family transporter
MKSKKNRFKELVLGIRGQELFRKPLFYLSILGPGLIATAAGNDAGGIATYAVAGAQFGVAFLWLIIPLTIGMYIVQEMAARLGAATGKGFSDLVRENFDLRATVFMMGLLTIANTAVVISNFIGMAAALELFGVSKFISIPILTGVIWWLVVKGTYTKVERLFMLMAAAMLSYVAAAILSKPNWTDVAHNLVIPHLSYAPSYISLLIAFVGTTIAPYMQIYAQSAVVERGITMSDFKLEKIDTLVGTILSNLITLFIVIATAYTLYPAGIKIESAAEAAKALTPFAGIYAPMLFGLGLFGASILAASVISLTTCFALSDAFGWESGVNRSLDEAPVFYTFFTVLLFIAAVITLTASVSLIQLLLNLQILNGILLPFELLFMLKLANNKQVMGKHVNGKIFNFGAWVTTIGVSGAAILYIVSTFFQALKSVFGF